MNKHQERDAHLRHNFYDSAVQEKDIKIPPKM